MCDGHYTHAVCESQVVHLEVAERYVWPFAYVASNITPLLALGEGQWAIVLQGEASAHWSTISPVTLSTYLGEYGGKDFDLLGDGCGVVHPVKLDRSLSDHESQVELCVLLAKTVVRASTEDQVVLGALLLSITRVVTLWVEVVWVLVHIGIAQGGVSAGNQHGALC